MKKRSSTVIVDKRNSTVCFDGCMESAEDLFGDKPISPSVMTKILWTYIRVNGVPNASEPSRKRIAKGATTSTVAERDFDELDMAPEGRQKLATHKRRERNATLVRNKKAMVMQTKGCLECEVCGFDFNRRYGPIGEGFIECHHVEPLGMATASKMTGLDDLALVCANCHRILHRKRLEMTVEQLRQQIMG